ncbi:hypothetical protein ACS386_06725 [Flavobacteriaceae bacterium LMO-SS05]
MKRLFLLFSILLLVSCSKNPEHFIPYLEGYWEIHEVTLPDGTKKTYSYNDTVDYIKITDSLTGYRTKLKPILTGGYQSSKDVEALKLKIENDSLNVYYKTPYSNWKETVLSASEQELLIINTAKVRYLYKRYEPLNLSDD